MRHLVVIITALVLLFGCASSGPSYKEQMDALLGTADKVYFAQKLGPPSNRIRVNENTEVWEYITNEIRGISTTGYQYHFYDQLLLTFKDDKLDAWSRRSKNR